MYPRSLVFLTLLGTGLLAASPSQLYAAPPLSAEAKAVLAGVPADVDVFAHLRAGHLWNDPFVKDVRKGFGKLLEEQLPKLTEYTGLQPVDMDTLTIYFPSYKFQPGEETQFVLVVTTNKNYDRSKLLTSVREKDAKEKDDSVALQADFVLNFTTPKTFAVLHKSLLASYRADDKKKKTGVLADAIKEASDHAFTGALNLKAIPDELFTNTPPDVKPFFPLLKGKYIALFGDLTGKELQVAGRLICNDADAAREANASLKLLIKLGLDELAEVQKKNAKDPDLAGLQPLFKLLTQSLTGVTSKQEGSQLSGVISMKTDQPVAEIVSGLVQNLTASAERARERNNLFQIVLALENYHSAMGHFPPAAILDKKGKPMLSWRVLILPYVEQQNLYEKIKLDEPWDSENNKKVLDQMPDVFKLADEEKKNDGKTHFRVFVGKGAMWDPLQAIKVQDITDGTSNTIMLVQAKDSVPWTKPEELAFDPEKEMKTLLHWKKDLTLVALADGSVHTLPKSIKEATLKAAITRAGGEPVDINKD